MREIVVPPEWVPDVPIVDGGGWATPGGELIGFHFADGTSIFALVYRGGVRFMRVTGIEGTEVREDGAPQPEEREEVEAAWAYLLQMNREAAVQARNEIDAIERRN